MYHQQKGRGYGHLTV